MNSIYPKALLTVLVCLGAASAAASDTFAGRWDLTIRRGETTRPSWMEVRQNQDAVTVSFVGPWGSAEPASDPKQSNGRLTFSTEDFFGHEPAMHIECELANGAVTGFVTSGKEKLALTGKRAPALNDSATPKWGDRIILFNGKNLGGWRFDDPARSSNWAAENGLLVCSRQGSNIITTREFRDFKLHVEFNCPANGNSGVYLRGRYEVQIEDDEKKSPPTSWMGGVYGFLAPENVVRRPGEWRSFDITLVGRTVSVDVDGKPVIRHREIPGITGGALDSNEDQPGPIYLQGDHGGLMFRNIEITPSR